MLQRHVGALLAAAVLAAIGSACASPASSELHLQTRPIGALGSGFIDLKKPPAPESTIRPAPGSWNAVHPPRSYRAVLLTSGDDRPTKALVTAVKHWAKVEHITLETITVTRAEAVDGIVEAIERRPHLIICAGNALVDPLALVTASYLDQQFLILGAQLPEPTVNVTAAIWKGASSRGSEVPDTTASFHQDAFTPERAGAALRAGVASVLHDITGIVVSFD